MAKVNIENIIFDLGGVLLDWNPEYLYSKIFDQEQIARAVELGPGASSPSEINLTAADEQSQGYRDRIVEILNDG